MIVFSNITLKKIIVRLPLNMLGYGTTGDKQTDIYIYIYTERDRQTDEWTERQRLREKEISR